MKTLPPLKPTDYLFEKFADKGNSKPEIFAWAARDIMARVAGIDTIEVQARDKAVYKAFITGKTDTLQFSGKTFTAAPMPSMIPCLRKKKKSPEAPEAKSDKAELRPKLE